MPQSACWTCRLRHKKCDESTPVCGTCAGLGITCHSGKLKPTWMDGGHLQEAMAQQFKAEVKRGARRRRGIDKIRNIVRGFELTDDGTLSEDIGSTPNTPPIPYRATDEVSNPSVHVNSAEQLISIDSEFAGSKASRAPFVPDVTDMGYLATYMDYVFPILFPFYRPSLLEGGRGWLPTIARSSQSFLASIVSLTSFFFSVIPVESGPGHHGYSFKTWDELHLQAQVALTSIRRDMHDLQNDGLDNSLDARVHLLGNIVQLLVFERETFASDQWQIHLPAALFLFEQILQLHGRDDQDMDQNMTTVLDKLPCPGPCSLNKERGAFLFYSAALVVYDVVASTSLGQVPRLLPLCLEPLAGEKPQLDLEGVSGCQGWVFSIIGQICALDEWKKRSASGGNLSVVDLQDQASLIDARWKACIFSLNNQESAHNAETMDTTQHSRPLESILLSSHCSFGFHPLRPDTYYSVTRVWAHAARVFLLVVSLGWQPQNEEIRECISQAIAALERITSPSWIRSLVWPICVCGCLATEEQRPIFRKILDNSAALKALMSVRNAFDIMERVWEQGDDIDANTWDITTCLSILGYKTLLV
ncbi:fungal-specific transcription factor domain-containing protein [Mariannaea sp. PMI_226]|nr:fungal-specific transcription factor domain-containing protein [Mariannaea sp. PMI_226]